MSTTGYGPDVPAGTTPAPPVRTSAGAGPRPADPGDPRDPGDATVGELVGTLTSDLSRLLRAELALAKAEAKQEVTHAGRGAGLLAGAGVGSHLALAFGSLAMMFGLGHWMALGWAALIVAVLWAIAAAALAASGRTALRTVNPALPETTETLKEDARWARKPLG